MAENTLDLGTSTCNDLVLALLRVANEQALQESGNQVYLKLKAEIQQLRCVI